MKRHLPSLYVIFFCLILAASKSATGQSRWGIDCKPSLNFPTLLFSGIKLQPGFGFDAQVTYHVAGNVSVYGGWVWALFPQNKTDGNALRVQRLGSSFGLKFTQPINKYNLEYYVKGGGLHQHLSIENSAQKHFNTDPHWGWQIESGLSLPLDYGIALQPGLKYTTVAGNIEENGSRSGFHLNDLSAGIILSIRFGGKR
jgi:hypothetical protein